MKKEYKIEYRCQTCNDPCDHIFSLKIFEDKNGFWAGQGPYPSEEAAEEIINKTISIVEERNKKNTA